MTGSSKRGTGTAGRWIRSLAVALAVALPGAGSIAAQVLPDEGDRLRVRTTDRWVVRGEYAGQTAEGVTLHTRDDGEVVIPWPLVDHTERSLGRSRDFPRTFTLTAGASALVGFVALGAVAWGEDSDSIAPAILALSPFVVAVPLGIVAGLLWKPERWEPIELRPPASVDLRFQARAGGGWSVGWAVRH